MMITRKTIHNGLLTPSPIIRCYIKKTPGGQRKISDLRDVSMRRERREITSLEQRSLLGSRGERMTSLDNICTRRELIFLCRDRVRLSNFFLLLPIRAYFERNLTGSETMLLKLESCVEAAPAWLCKDLADLLFNLGVIRFRGLDLGGCVIMSDLGDKNKKDFLATTWRAGGGEFELAGSWTHFWRGYFIDKISAVYRRLKLDLNSIVFT